MEIASSRDDFNVLDNFNVSSIKTAVYENCSIIFFNQSRDGLPRKAGALRSLDCIVHYELG